MNRLTIVIALLCSYNSFAQLINGEELKKQLYYDSTLNGMRLRDPRSVEVVIGTTENMIDPQDGTTEVLSSTRGQVLTMIFHPGDVVNLFSQFKVEYNTQKLNSKYKIRDKAFLTGKGIKLGITEQQLLKILGKPAAKENDDGYTRYSYKQNDGLYFGSYWFKKGKLAKFWYGEEYP